jgi:osmotically-inducible protein OsmY
MPNRPPKTYDEIVRATVPEPDSSWRPTPAQEQQAREGFRAMDAEEQQLHQRVLAAMASASIDTSRIQIEIDRDRVTLRGQVRDRETLTRVAQVVGEVDGVRAVLDQLVIAA